MQNWFMCIVVAALFAAVPCADAFDYYGASIADKELATSYWKFGLDGFRPIVRLVQSGSPAEKHGLKAGDIILAINGKNITKTAELYSLTADGQSITILRGYERKTVVMDRVAGAPEQVKQVAGNGQPAAVAPSTAVTRGTTTSSQQTDAASALRFDDDALEKKYGKTTPEQREALRKQDFQRLQQEKAADVARKRREAEEEQKQKAEKEAAEAAKKQQELLDRQRREAEEREAARRYREEIRQQQLNDMQEKINRLEEERRKREKRPNG